MIFNNRVMEGEGAAGGVGTPPPAASTPPPAAVDAGKAGDPAFYAGWKNEVAKGWVQSKGFKDSEMLAESALNLEKLHGVPRERLLKLPEKADDVEGWNEVHSKLGRPATSKDYKYNLPEGANEEFIKAASDHFYKKGMSQDQAQSTVEWYNAYAEAAQKAQQEAFVQGVERDKLALKKEWGAAYGEKIKDIQKAMKQFGVDDSVLSNLEKQMGTVKTLKFLSDVGGKIGEHDLETGTGREGFQGNLTPANARSQREYLMSDPEFLAKYQSKDPAVREAANKRIFSLFEMENAGN